MDKFNKTKPDVPDGNKKSNYMDKFFDYIIIMYKQIRIIFKSTFLETLLYKVILV